MKLDRNIEGNEGHGKYAILKLRNLELCRRDNGILDTSISEALKVLEQNNILDWGIANTESEFFLIRLKDENAHAALSAYAAKARQNGDKEFSGEVDELAARSGVYSRFCKKPD